MEQNNQKAKVGKECPVTDPDYISMREIVGVCNYSQLSRKTGLHRNTLARFVAGFPIRYSVLHRLMNFFNKSNRHEEVS